MTITFYWILFVRQKASSIFCFSWKCSVFYMNFIANINFPSTTIKKNSEKSQYINKAVQKEISVFQSKRKFVFDRKTFSKWKYSVQKLKFFLFPETASDGQTYACAICRTVNALKKNLWASLRLVNQRWWIRISLWTTFSLISRYLTTQSHL